MFASPVDESRDTKHEMLAYRPQTAAEMLGISGVGQKKLDRYVSDITDIDQFL